MAASDKPTIFISYSHKDERWKDRLLPFLDALKQSGHELVVWHDRDIDAGEKWYPEIEQAMEQAAATVCLVSANYLASDFCQKEEVPFLMARRGRDGMLLLPVLVDECPWELFDWISETQMLPRDRQSLIVDFEGRESIVLTSVARRIHEFLHTHEYRPPAPPTPKWPALPAEHVDLTRLPETGAALFGRKDEMQMLDEAWDSDGKRVVALVAWGGVGKSTLANHWIERMSRDNFRGAERVFGWSFYSQGTGERVTSADLFVAEALEFFGDPDPEVGSPWDRGQRLARLVASQRALLVLDGMEPLQSGFDIDRGKVTDPALAALLRGLARPGNTAASGLCLITTRESVSDLAGFAETAKEQNLERISPEAGRALLRVGGVVGTDEELENLAREFGPHALAISLLASYLHEHPGHRPDAAAALPALPDVTDQDARHVRRVLAGFEQLLGQGPELNFLRILGLFDRPAKSAELAAIVASPSIPDLTSHVSVPESRKPTTESPAVRRLRRLGLVAPHSTHQPDAVDAHPLVREHFGQQLREQFPEAWREGHNRLYEHLKSVAPELPDTLEQMMPLFAAVTHGCLAGRHKQAYDDVYRPRTCRGNEHYQIHKLGAFGADLAAIAGFFERTWDTPVSSLTEDDQAWLLNAAGFRLRALGRLTEAVQPMQASLDGYIRSEDWKNGAVLAGNLSELSLTIGRVADAVQYAEQSVELADRSGDEFMRMANRTTLADALHQAGRLDEAGSAFREAEKMQKERQPSYPLLYSVQGYQYCDLLLTRADFGLRIVTIASRPSGRWQSQIANRKSAMTLCRDVQKRAAQTLEWAEVHLGLLDVALDHLSLGRAYLLEAVITESADWAKARQQLDQAVEGLREAGSQHHLPRGLLARAALRRLSGDLDAAAADLDEALEIAERGGMRLHLCDCHLESACQQLALHSQQPAPARLAQARECVAKDKDIVQDTGYHRRDREIELLEDVLDELT